MILVKPSYEILSCPDGETALKLLELAGRTCWKSEGKASPGSAPKFVKMIMGKNHQSVLEHQGITVKFVCDRGVSHELVRHRLASFSQESTRYVNYSRGNCTFVLPPWVDFSPGEYESVTTWECFHLSKGFRWFQAMLQVERDYNALLLEDEWKPEQARSILPNSTKTEIVVTANIREWCHIFSLRVPSPPAHPQISEIMTPLLAELKTRIPVVFDDLFPEKSQ